MKNISPVSPPEEVVPEPGPNRFASLQPQQAPASDQAATPPVPQPPQPNPDAPPVTTPNAGAALADMQSDATQVAEKAFYQTAPSLYPTPLSADERAAQNNAAFAPSNRQSMAISQYFIPVIVGIYSLYVLWQLVRALFGGAVTGLLATGGSMTNYLLLALLAGVFQYGVILYASYQLFRGSKAGLALVTGAALLILPQYLLVFGFSGLRGAYFTSLGSGFQFVALLVLAVLLIYAWTKERSAYN